MHSKLMYNSIQIFSPARPQPRRSWKKVLAEDYSDLDPNKVVLSFRGRGEGTEVNIVDKCLEEIAIRRREEAAEKAIASTSRVFDENVPPKPAKAAGEDADEEESDIEIRQVLPRNVL